MNNIINNISLAMSATTTMLGLYKYFTAETEISKLRGEVYISIGGLLIITLSNKLLL